MGSAEGGHSLGRRAGARALARLRVAARALALDEPALGLAPAAVERLYEEVEAMRAEGIGVALVEQDALRVARAGRPSCRIGAGRDHL